MENIHVHSWTRSISYETYMKMIANLVTNKATSGSNQEEGLVNYTKLNFSRMKRLNKTVIADRELVETISELPYKMKWLIITEAWCGDAAQNIPYIAKSAAECRNVELGLVLRDENPELIDKYLTNGGRSIPKLIVLNAANMDSLADWGPRPERLQEIVLDYNEKPEPKIDFSEFAETIHKWYNSDKNKNLRNELMAIFSGLN